MADTKISALTALAGADVDVAADVLPIVDTGVTTTKKILVEELAKAVAATQAQVNAMTSTSTLLTPNINKIVLGTEQNSTSGTSIDFTGIPSGVRRITVMLEGVSTGGSSLFMIQIGDSGGLETSGYTGGASTDGGTRSDNSNGFKLGGSYTAAASIDGTFVLNLKDSTNNTWTFFGLGYRSDQVMHTAAGTKSLSATLDRLSLTTVSGDTFDAGSINISYER